MCKCFREFKISSVQNVHPQFCAAVLHPEMLPTLLPSKPCFFLLSKLSLRLGFSIKLFCCSLEADIQCLLSCPYSGQMETQSSKAKWVRLPPLSLIKAALGDVVQICRQMHYLVLSTQSRSTPLLSHRQQWTGPGPSAVSKGFPGPAVQHISITHFPFKPIVNLITFLCVCV